MQKGAKCAYGTFLHFVYLNIELCKKEPYDIIDQLSLIDKCNMFNFCKDEGCIYI